MEDDLHADVAPPPSGGLIRLQARAVDLGSWLGPMWAALCGVLASNAFNWQDGDWVQVALLLLLVDAGWGTLWAALASTDWTLAFRRWRPPSVSSSGGEGVGDARNEPTVALPYTLPGTPGDRISRWMGRMSSWWQRVLWPTCGAAVRAVFVALPLTALMAALLGPELLLLSVAALGLMQLGVIWEGGRGVAPSGWDALIAITLPWLAGHVTFASATLPSVGLATLFGLAWGSAWRTTSRWVRAVLIASQLSSAAYLVVLHRPLAAGALSLFLVPQMALLPWVRRDLSTARFARHTRVWLMAAMAVAALVL